MFDKQQPAVNIMRVFCKLRVSRYDTVRVDGHGGGGRSGIRKSEGHHLTSQAYPYFDDA